MKRLSLFSICFILVAMSLTGCARHHVHEGHRTFFVVPVELPDGTDSAPRVEALETWLVDRAGGFTRLGTAEGAWKSPSGEVIREENHVYIVGIYSGDPAKFTEELEGYIVEQFDQQEAWIERW